MNVQKRSLETTIKQLGCDSITFTRHAFGKVNTEPQMSLYFVKLFAATLPPSDSPYVDSLVLIQSTQPHDSGEV